MLSYKEMLREVMNDNGLTYKEAMEYKYDYGVWQCEDCKGWTLDPTDMATSGGIDGEDSICEHCFENSQSSVAVEVRRVVSEYHQQ